MPLAKSPARHSFQLAALVTLVFAVACGQPLASPPTPLASTTPPGISQDDVRLPTAWLVIGGEKVPGTLAAGGTPQGHFDPARTLPGLKTAILPREAKVVIAIESNLLQGFMATVRPWASST